MDTVASQSGDQRDRDRSGLTLLQVSVETNETERRRKTRPSSFFQEAGPEVSTQLTGKKQS